MSRTTRWHLGSARRTMLLSSIGCALLVLLSVAVSSTLAGTAKSATEGSSSASQQLSASLILPAADELLGEDQTQLARAARRSNPVAVQRRAASRSAFEDPSLQQAISETNHAFPGLPARTAGGTPQLAAGERIVRYPTSNAAQISLPGRVGVIEAIEPIASRDSHGAHVPFDLSLARAGNSYAPVRSPVELSVPSALSHGVALPELGVSLVPVDRRGVPLAASEGKPDGAAVLWNVADGAGVQDVATVARASLRGFDLSTLLFSQRSPSQLYFHVGMPTGARLTQEPDGSVRIVKRNEPIAVISPVSAEDAEGTSVPVSVNVSGNAISVHVDTKATTCTRSPSTPKSTTRSLRRRRLVNAPTGNSTPTALTSRTSNPTGVLERNFWKPKPPVGTGRTNGVSGATRQRASPTSTKSKPKPRPTMPGRA